MNGPMAEKLAETTKRIVADLGELPIPEGAVWQESGRHPGWQHCKADFVVPATLAGEWDKLVAFVTQSRRKCAEELLALIEKGRPAAGSGRTLVVLKNWWMRATVVQFHGNQKTEQVFMDRPDAAERLDAPAGNEEKVGVFLDCTVRYAQAGDLPGDKGAAA